MTESPSTDSPDSGEKTTRQSETTTKESETSAPAAVPASGAPAQPDGSQDTVDTGDK